jgi:hypothetical protein
MILVAWLYVVLVDAAAISILEILVVTRVRATAHAVRWGAV